MITSFLIGILVGVSLTIGGIALWIRYDFDDDWNFHE